MKTKEIGYWNSFKEYHKNSSWWKSFRKLGNYMLNHLYNFRKAREKIGTKFLFYYFSVFIGVGIMYGLVLNYFFPENTFLMKSLAFVMSYIHSIIFIDKVFYKQILK